MSTCHSKSAGELQLLLKEWRSVLFPFLRDFFASALWNNAVLSENFSWVYFWDQHDIPRSKHFFIDSFFHFQLLCLQCSSLFNLFRVKKAKRSKISFLVCERLAFKVFLPPSLSIAATLLNPRGIFWHPFLETLVKQGTKVQYTTHDCCPASSGNCISLSPGDQVIQSDFIFVSIMFG